MASSCVIGSCANQRVQELLSSYSVRYLNRLKKTALDATEEPFDHISSGVQMLVQGTLLRTFGAIRDDGLNPS